MLAGPAEWPSTNRRTFGTVWTILAYLKVAKAVGTVYDGGLKVLEVEVKSVRRSVGIMYKCRLWAFRRSLRIPDGFIAKTNRVHLMPM